MYSLYDTWGFPCVFPHSEISGSLAMCAYPKLIAAYHVLHRLLMPRHSPCALCSLTFTRLLYLITSSTVKSIHSRTQVLFISYLSCFLVLSYIKLRNLSVKNFQSFALNITKNISWLTSQYVLKLYIIHVQFSKNKIYSYKLSITTSTSSLCYSRVSYAPLLIRRFLVLLASNSKLILRNMVSQN